MAEPPATAPTRARPRVWAAVLAPVGRLDRAGVALCLAAQLVVIAGAALLSPETGVRAPANQAGVVELFAHNLLAWVSWVAGGLTLGVATVAQALVSSVFTGATLRMVFHEQGLSVLAFLGHSVFELPAFAIAMWLALRVPLVLAAHRHLDDPPPVTATVLRSLGPLTLLSVGLLVAAAVLETVVQPGV